MARKQKSGKKDSDGKHRKETREERRIRLEKQQEAREVRGGKPLRVRVAWKWVKLAFENLAGHSSLHLFFTALN